MKNRRSIIKSISLGVWCTPVIQTVMVPAHAQTSATTTSQPQPNILIDFIPLDCIAFTPVKSEVVLSVTNIGDSTLILTRVSVTNNWVVETDPSNLPTEITPGSGISVFLTSPEETLDCVTGVDNSPPFTLTLSFDGYSDVTYRG